MNVGFRTWLRCVTNGHVRRELADTPGAYMCLRCGRRVRERRATRAGQVFPLVVMVLIGVTAVPWGVAVLVVSSGEITAADNSARARQAEQDASMRDCYEDPACDMAREGWRWEHVEPKPSAGTMLRPLASFLMGMVLVGAGAFALLIAAETVRDMVRIRRAA